MGHNFLTPMIMFPPPSGGGGSPTFAVPITGGQTNGTSNLALNLRINIPAGAAVGDLLVNIRSAGTALGAPTITGGTLSGFNVSYGASAGIGEWIVVWKIADASDVGGGTIILSSAQRGFRDDAWVVTRSSGAWTGIDVAQSISATKTANSITTSTDAFAIVSIMSTDLLVGWTSLDNGYTTITTGPWSPFSARNAIVGQKQVGAGATGVVNPDLFSGAEAAMHMAFY